MEINENNLLNVLTRRERVLVLVLVESITGVHAALIVFIECGMKFG